MMIPYLSQTYEARSSNVSAKRTLNFYMQFNENEGKDTYCLIGTPGTQTFTRDTVSNATIASIQGDGGVPNTVTVTTTSAHGYSAGQIFNVTGTPDYDESVLTIVSVPTTTTFTYQTFNNTLNSPDLMGTVDATGESPITDVTDLSSGCRGLYTTSTGRVVACFGAQVFEIFDGGTWASLFFVTNFATNVSFTDDGRSLVFVDGSVMRVMDMTTNTVQTIDTQAQAGFQNPEKVVFSNNRIVCINSDTDTRNDNKIFWSNLLDATTWDALDFASAEQSADPIISIEVTEGQLWLFGPRSYEILDIDVNPDLPYRYVGGSATEIGCGAKDSTSTIAGRVFTLGSSTAGSNVVYMSNGYTLQRISTHAVEFFLVKSGLKTTDAVGFSYQQEGHIFYILNFLQAEKTFVYDLTSGLWHERSTRDANFNTFKRWSPLFATFGHGRILTGDSESPRIFTLELDRYFEWDGRPIVRLHQGPILWDDLRLIFHKEFQLDIETGVGLQAGLPIASGIQDGQGANPQIMMQHSDDGGHTWSSERWTTLGKVGQYKARARWRRLGRSRERVYRIQISDPVKCVVLGGRIIAEIGSQP